MVLIVFNPSALQLEGFIKTNLSLITAIQRYVLGHTKIYKSVMLNLVQFTDTNKVVNYMV
jgi:hypothetical protein